MLNFKGPQSLGSILQNTHNLDTVPSPKFKSPKGGNYYSGGYITQKHGSRDNIENRVNAIQMELPYKLRSDANYKNSALILSQALHEFYLINKFDRKITGSDSSLEKGSNKSSPRVSLNFSVLFGFCFFNLGRKTTHIFLV